ncbi:MAG: prolipoprotein diacylglyceryl transferase family protein [Solirubrobacteraceae bacterium]
MVWNLGLAAALVWVGHHRRIRAPGLFALYVAGYSLGRIGEELLRVDPAHHLFGFRVNFFVAAILFAGAMIWFAHTQGLPARWRRPTAILIAGGASAAALCGCGHGQATASARTVAPVAFAQSPRSVDVDVGVPGDQLEPWAEAAPSSSSQSATSRAPLRRATSSGVSPS